MNQATEKKPLTVDELVAIMEVEGFDFQLPNRSFTPEVAKEAYAKGMNVIYSTTNPNTVCVWEVGSN